MEELEIVKALSAIAHESRLAVFRLLVQAGPKGMPAGKVAELTGLPLSTLSFHLKELVSANMVNSKQEGRFVIYSARYETMNTVLAYLTENCCGGNRCIPAPSAVCCPQGEPS
ncbi:MULTISPECIES: ArsR/SmtB family transcription factor [Herbaspirillum]|uniref:ArsR/SmtB family transcription factor n=1 Tax=Herbaspirillum TaxID=963 RepID=UPI0005CB66F8|nr:MULTISPECIES: metalloregulator ArsR/SmtB family transcription factor [Herbaspirillum]